MTTRPMPPQLSTRPSAAGAPPGSSAARPDRVLLFLLAVLSLGSAATTIMGARQILPSPLAETLGVLVQLMLFLILAGAAGRHAPVRKWFVAVTFAAVSVYTSFFAYYAHLAGEAVGNANLDRARQAHADFVGAHYPALQGQVDTLENQATTLYDLSEREAAGGLTTGKRGFGAQAKAYAEQARDAELAAAELKGDLERLSPRFTADVAGWDAEQIYAFDLETWQTMPATWQVVEAAPARDVYQDLEHEIALLAPWYKVRAGEDAAVVALLLATMVDGVCLLLGTAIRPREQRILDSASSEAAAFIGSGRAGAARVQQAWTRPSPEQIAQTDAAVSALGDPLRVVELRIDGRGSDFLGAFYQAIHPETGALDYARLQGHPNPTFRLAARMLSDRLRSASLGWVRVDDGYWCVPPDAYERFSFWLADQVQQELMSEAAEDPLIAPAQPADIGRTVRLVLPARVA